MLRKFIFSLILMSLPICIMQAQDVILKADAQGNEATFADNRTNINPSTCQIVTTAEGQRAYEVEILTQSKTAYDAELKVVTTGEVSTGDVMLAKVVLRTIFAGQETGECAAHLYFQRAVSPWEKSLATQISAGSDWRTIYIPFVAKQSFAPGEAAISIAFGSLRQKVQVADIEVQNFHHTRQLSDLPVTRLSYTGREANARWRSEALARIDSLRTAPLKVTVVDADGRPVRNANVHIEICRSAFLWGTAVNEQMLAGEHPDSEHYGKQLKEFFNTAVIENGFKGAGWFWDDSRKLQTLKAYQWLKDNGLRQRGHNLVWPGWKFNPRNLRWIAEHDTAAFHRLVLSQLYERMAITKGSLIHWDVINEMMHEKDFDPYLPDDWAVEVFKLARQLDPDAKLFINDYAMLNGSHSPLVIKDYIDLIKQLRAKGAPIDAAGVQGHVGTQPRSPIQVLADLNLFADEDIKVAITEFDINTDDEELQADYTRDFLIACYSHPSVEGIILWGFWESKHWKPQAAMFRKDWSERPAATHWRNLVCKAWRTDVSAKTDRFGIVKTRGHLGEYTITVSAKGITRRTTCMLSNDGAEVIVRLLVDLPSND